MDDVVSLGLLAALLCLQSAPTVQQQPLFIVLRDTGRTEGTLPVVEPAPNAAEYHRLLSRGFSGRLLWLYQREQEYLRRQRGASTAPAYLVLTAHEGGFPKTGFVLNGVSQPSVGYVDLSARQTVSGRFGAMDQIFPHELLHIIVRQLTGDPPAGGANQVHAVAVRTDPQVAWDEGLAETMQVLAIDDPDAPAETRALAQDPASRANAERHLARYQNAMESWISIAPKAVMTFPAWYSGTEQALRYYAVRENRFIYEPSSSALLHRNLYRAYLVGSIVPGSKGAAIKPSARALATEGVIATLGWRLLSDSALQRPVDDVAFYERFGTTRSEVSPLGNAFLKVFFVLAERKPHDAASFVDAWRDVFPSDAPAVDRVTREVVGTFPADRPKEVWLLSNNLETGTTIFDQFRGIPRAHTFDLNAASDIDLYSIQEMTPAIAARLRAAGPYANVADLKRSGVPEPVLSAINHAADAMRALRSKKDDEESLSLNAILMPYLWRAALVWAICGAAAGLVFRRVRGHAAWRSALTGGACALIALLAAWTIDPTEGWLALGAPLLLLGVPAAIVDFARRRVPARIPRILVAWGLAALPSLVVVHPLF